VAYSWGNVAFSNQIQPKYAAYFNSHRPQLSVISRSRHAWDVRLISLEALLRLAEVKEELSDWETSNKINQLLRPVEYTRLDGIVELLFAAKRDLELADTVAPPSEDNRAGERSSVSRSDLESARERAIALIEKRLSCNFVRRGRALRESSDGLKRLVCLASQRYEGPSESGNYWYGFTPSQNSFLSARGEGWVALACADSNRVFLAPWKQFQAWLPACLTTPAGPVTVDEVRHWHVYFYDFGNYVDLMKSGGGVITDLTPFLI